MYLRTNAIAIVRIAAEPKSFAAKYGTFFAGDGITWLELAVVDTSTCKLRERVSSFLGKRNSTGFPRLV